MKLSALSLSILLIFPMLSAAEVTTKITSTGQQKNTAQQLKNLYQQEFKQQKTIPRGWRIPGNNP